MQFFDLFVVRLVTQLITEAIIIYILLSNAMLNGFAKKSDFDLVTLILGEDH